MKGWEVRKLGEVCEIYQPKTISAKDLIEDGPFHVFGANGIIGRYDKFNHEEPQLLITCRGATCGAVNISLPKSWITGNAMVVRPKFEALSVRFLEFFFRGACDFSKIITGAAQPQITRQSLAPVAIAFPPLDEQRRIVAILDEAFAGLAVMRQHAEANLKNARALFNSHLNAIFSQPGEGWVESTLGEMSKVISGQHIMADDYNSDGKGTPYLTGPSDFGELNPLVSKWTTKPKVIAFPGDILVTVKGSGVGKVNLLQTERSAISRQLMAIRSTRLDQRFAFFVLQSRFAELQAKATGAAIPGLSREQILSLAVQAPSLDEQRRIVNILDEVRIETARLESLYRQKLAAIDELKQSILHRAFSGALSTKDALAA